MALPASDPSRGDKIGCPTACSTLPASAAALGPQHLHMTTVSEGGSLAQREPGIRRQLLTRGNGGHWAWDRQVAARPFAPAPVCPGCTLPRKGEEALVSPCPTRRRHPYSPYKRQGHFSEGCGYLNVGMDNRAVRASEVRPSPRSPTP